MGIAQNMETLWVAFLICQLGWALYSGSAEALAYDTLKDTGKEEDYDKVAATAGYLINIASITATLLGGLMYALWYRSTHLAWGLSMLIGFFLTFALKEPKTDTEKFSFKNYFLQLKHGIVQIFKPKLLPFLVVILFLLGSSYIFEWGLVKPTMAMKFGFDANWQAILFALFGLVGALTIRTVPYLRKVINDRVGLYLLTAILGIGFIIAYFDLKFFGVIPLLLITVAGTLATPWVSVVFNVEIDSKYRATALSTIALLTKIPYVLVAILAGNMAQNDTFHLFNGGLGLLIIGSIVISLLLFPQKK